MSNSFRAYSAILSSALLLVACSSGGRNLALPAWATPGGLTDAAAAVQLDGVWTLNAGLSDDPQQLLRKAVEKLKKNQRRATISDNSTERDGIGPRIKISDGPQSRDLYANAAISDPRLAALRATSVLINRGENAIAFTFDNTTPVHYLINQATSTDQNINLTFADWEGSQFVVEKNGPAGLVLERWILSPDGSQLYLLVSVEIKMPESPLPMQPVLIGRMFDRSS